MKKVQELTQEQTLLMSKYRDDWIEYGFSTADIVKEEAISAVNLAYTWAKMKLPTHFIFVDGPTHGMKAANYAEEIYAKLQDGSTDADNAWSTIQTFAKKALQTISPVSYGSQSAGWASFYSFFDDQFGFANQAQGLINIVKTCGWVWMYEDMVIISSKPTKISMRNGLVHSETGAAISYKDGTEIFCYDGVSIPKEWVLEKNTIDPGIIMSHTDVDVRAKGIALLGYDKLKHKLDYKIIQGDPETDIGALIELKIPGLSEPGRFLEAICPRNGPVFLGVPTVNPVDNKDITTAIGAQAFLARLPTDEYIHPALRT